MARISSNESLAAFADATAPQGKRLVVLGQGSYSGRASSMLRMRPTLMKRLGELAVGQQYLLIDVALQTLIRDLETRDPADVLVVRATSLAATEEDHQLIQADKKSKARLKGEPKASAKRTTKPLP